MNIRKIEPDELRRMHGKEGLILQGCGGSLEEWVDGMNNLLTQEGILLEGSTFQTCMYFERKDMTCLLLPFEDVKLDVGKLAIWRLGTYDTFGGTWLSDYVPNRLGGFVNEEKTVKPDCALIGQDFWIRNWSSSYAWIRKLMQNGFATRRVRYSLLCRRKIPTHFSWYRSSSNRCTGKSLP